MLIFNCSLFKLNLTQMATAMQLTEFTAGGNNEADIATPTNEPALPPNIDNATPAPDGNAINTPTHKPRIIPLNK